MIKLIGILSVILLLQPQAYSASPDNLKFFNGLADSATTLFLSSITINDEDGFIIKSSQPHQADFIVEQSCINQIKAHNGIAFLQSQTSGSEPPVAKHTIEFKIISAGLRYEKADNPHPPGKKIWRKGTLEVIFRLISNHNGEVIETKEAIIANEDFISRKEAKEFSSKGNLYLIPEMSDGFKRYAEPILVGATVVTLVLLFFSNR